MGIKDRIKLWVKIKFLPWAKKNSALRDFQRIIPDILGGVICIVKTVAKK